MEDSWQTLQAMSAGNRAYELACIRALLGLSCGTFLMANGSALYFKNFTPSVHLISAAFSFMAYYVCAEVNYTLITDEGVYMLIYYIAAVVEYLGILSLWLLAVEVFRLTPRVPVMWIMPYLLYLLALGLIGVKGICFTILGIVKMILNATTPPSIVDAIPKANLVSLYLLWLYVGGVFLLFLFYLRKVNHFYGSFIFYYMLLVPAILVSTITENVLTKTSDHDIYVAFTAKFVCYRLFYLFAIFWASLFCAQWAKPKDVRQPHDVTATDVVDIDIDDIGEFDEKAEEGSMRHYAVV